MPLKPCTSVNPRRTDSEKKRSRKNPEIAPRFGFTLFNSPSPFSLSLSLSRMHSLSVTLRHSLCFSRCNSYGVRTIKGRIRNLIIPIPTPFLASLFYRFKNAISTRIRLAFEPRANKARRMPTSNVSNAIEINFRGCSLSPPDWGVRTSK